MVFVDELAFYLFSLAFSSLILAYFMSEMYFAYRKNDMDIRSRLEGLSMPIGLMGGYLLVTGVVSQFIWSLPGAYDILFFDPLVSFGLILAGLSLSIRYKTATRYIGFLALLFGVMTILYGVNAYLIGLSEAPLEVLILFVIFGGAAIMTYPATYIMDRFPKSKRGMKLSYRAVLVTLWILLIAGGLLAFTIGGMALPGHLATPP